MKKLFTLLFCCLSIISFAQNKEEASIRSVLTAQIESWNKGDLEGYMQTYWKSDSLSFIGKSGMKRGWQTTLDNYKKGYPDTTAMGKLSFEILEIKMLSKEYAYVIGKWHLKRSIGDLNGSYTLLLRKIKGEWKIVSDHSS